MSMYNVRYFVPHHSATKRGNNQLYAINRYHKQEWDAKSKLGWYVGYHGLIDSDGTFTQTRLIGEETIGVRGHNWDIPARGTAIHICIVFDGMSELPSDKQIATLRDVYHGRIPLKHDTTVMKGQVVNLSKLEVKFHRDLQAQRLCPGDLVTYPMVEKWLFGGPTAIDVERKQYQDEIKRLTSQLDLLREGLRKLLGN